MRIISGKFKSRKLKTPGKDQKVRPTTDRARETLFNILNNRIDLKDTECLDLFCGTGSFGLECISRGSQKCTFVDKDIRLVKENINALGVNGFCEAVRGDVLNFLQCNKALSGNLIFCDPPYNFDKYDELLELLKISGALVIIEHDKKFIPGNDTASFLIITKKIGITNFSIFDFKK
jgi:16S rRNA (guanine966-N2)-methyltransferase